MAHIVDFEIDGLAGRPDTYAHTLNEDMNIFFGPNGSGKTTLLKVLNSAMSGVTDILKGIPFTRATVRIRSLKYDAIYVRTFDQQSQVTAGRLKQDILGEEPKTRWITDPPIPDKPDGFFCTYLPISRLYSRAPRQHSLLWAEVSTLDDEQLENAFSTQVQNLWTSYQSDVSQRIKKDQETGLARILQSVLAPLEEKTTGLSSDPRKAFELVRNFLQRQPEYFHFDLSEREFALRFERDLQLKNIVGHIEEVETAVLQATAPQRQLKNLLDRMLLNKKIELTEKEIIIKAGERKLNLPSLSSGEKQVILIFLTALNSYVSSLIIDEPELSLHVDWQKHLIATLRLLNPESQIIAATHSPEIMADISDDKIFRL